LVQREISRKRKVLRWRDITAKHKAPQGWDLRAFFKNTIWRDYPENLVEKPQ